MGEKGEVGRDLGREEGGRCGKEGVKSEEHGGKFVIIKILNHT